MAGLEPQTPIPTEIKLHQASRVLEVAFADGTSFRLPYEYLRVYSPSAEVRGHGPGQETLQVGKREVSDHGSRGGRPLRDPAEVLRWPRYRHLLLGLPVRPRVRQDELWQRYLERLAAAGASRDPRSECVRPLRRRAPAGITAEREA